MKAALGAVIGAAALVAALGAQAGSSVRPGFEPQWFTAISATEFWLGGKGVVLHTSDGGRHFGRLPAPPAGPASFADSRDGFAFGWQTQLYATHGGGRAWHRLALRSVLAFAASGGTAYAVTGRCTEDGSCRDVRFQHSAVSSDAWISAPMPFAHAVPNFELATRGSNVWLFGGSSAGRHRLRNLLARSTNDGRTFVTDTAPCDAELAAELEPVSARIVWAFCPTGLMGIAYRSTDGGARFKPLRIPRCCPNSTALAPVSESVAVASANAAGSHLVRTTDGGATWRSTRTPRGITDWGKIVFKGRVGLALVSIGSRGDPALLRTTDAGTSWQAVPIR